MSAQGDLGFVVEVGAPNTLDPLRHALEAAQAEAVRACQRAGDIGGEDIGEDELAADFMAVDRVQAEVLRWVREWRERDAGGWDDDEEDWAHPEGPLTADEREMLVAYEAANEKLNGLRGAIYALRAAELAELQRAGVAPSLGGGR